MKISKIFTVACTGKPLNYQFIGIAINSRDVFFFKDRFMLAPQNCRFLPSAWSILSLWLAWTHPMLRWPYHLVTCRSNRNFSSGKYIYRQTNGYNLRKGDIISARKKKAPSQWAKNEISDDRRSALNRDNS
jgi:hypothetical protein